MINGIFNYTRTHRNDGQSTFDMKILKNSRCFRPRRAVGFDRAGGAIESNCPSGLKTSRIFQNFHVECDTTVRHFDGFWYNQCFGMYLERDIVCVSGGMYGKRSGSSDKNGSGHHSRPDYFEFRIWQKRLAPPMSGGMYG